MVISLSFVTHLLAFGFGVIVGLLFAGPFMVPQKGLD